MEDMMNYILKEKKVLLSVIDQRKRLLSLLINNNVKVSLYERIIIYATGSSSNAAHCAKLYMQNILNIPVDIQEPSMAKNYEPYFDEKFLYIAISQSGSSYSTIEIVKEIKKKGIKNIFTLTSNEDSPIAKISPNLLNLGIGIEEVPFVTLGVTGTVLYLVLISLELAKLYNIISDKTYETQIVEIKQAVHSIEEAITRSKNWYQSNASQLKKAKRFVFIGYGSSYGVAREAETKITETVRVPTNSHELEEYMHGPYIGLNKDDYIIMFNPYGKLDGRMKLLRNFLDNHVENVFMIKNDKENMKNNEDLKLNLHANELLAPICMLVTVHILAYELSIYHKVDLTKSSYPDFDVALKSKINK